MRPLRPSAPFLPEAFSDHDPSDRLWISTNLVDAGEFLRGVSRFEVRILLFEEDDDLLTLLFGELAIGGLASVAVDEAFGSVFLHRPLQTFDVAWGEMEKLGGLDPLELFAEDSLNHIEPVDLPLRHRNDLMGHTS